MPSIIVPIDLGRRPQQLLERVARLISSVKDTRYELVIGHADRGMTSDESIKELVRTESGGNVILVSESFKTGASNMARVRNMAVKCATKSVVLLLDVDIYPDLQLFDSLTEAVGQGAPLSMAPCLYLSQKGTALIAHGGKGSILESYFCFSPEFVLHLATPSSVMAFKRDDYWEIGGFFEGYEGHGYEDFDFMLRLALEKKLIRTSPNLLVDRNYRAPLLAEGFRGGLANLSLENLLDGNFAFHLFHNKDQHEYYYQSRAQNALLFNKRVSERILYSSQDNPELTTPDLVINFYAQCYRRGIDPARFYALFDARPRYMLKKKSLLQRIARAIKVGVGQNREK